ncbi:MAG: glycosyltransferase family 4 protein [Candidatus Gracilibacteria bacterium]
MPIRLCIIDQGEIFGGAECFALDLIRMLPKDVYEVHVCISKNAHSTYKQALEEMHFVKVHEITIPQLRPLSLPKIFQFVQSCFSLFQILRKTKAQIIYTNTVRAHLVGSVVSLLRNTPLIWVLHDFTFPKAFIKRLIFIPKKVIGVSEVVLEYVQDTCGQRWDDKFVVIPNGVTIEKVLTPSLETLSDLEKKPFIFEDSKRYIGIIGRIDVWKGQDIFLKAAKILKEQYPQHEHLEFVVVGGITATDKERKQYAENLQTYAKENELSNVTFLGHQDIENILPRLHILIQASTAPEPFGRTVIEAFQAGIPVVAANIGALKSIVAYGQNGLSFEPGNPQDLAQKIALLLEDKHLYNTVKVNAERDVRAKYSMQRVLDMFIEVLQTISVK